MTVQFAQGMWRRVQSLLMGIQSQIELVNAEDSELRCLQCIRKGHMI